jgi:hypothetical protein
MLQPSQVIPFFQHSDPYVRTLAVRYFLHIHDPSPATADDLWKMIDQHGPGQHATETYRAMRNLPQSEASLRRTLAAIEDDELEETTPEKIITNLPYGFLTRYCDLIENSPAVHDWVREHLRQRMELAPLSPAELWEKLVAHSGRIDRNEEVFGDDAENTSKNLMEALARNPESAQWAWAALSERKGWTYLAQNAMRLLGRMRYRPAAGMIVGALDEDELEYIADDAAIALIEIGGADVVRLVHERYPKLKWGRISALDVLRGIKLPQSEAALTDLLMLEADASLRTRIASALCGIAASEPRAMEKIRDMLSKNEWDRTLLELDAEAVALFTMVGYGFPELPAWRAALDDEPARKKAVGAAHQQWFNNISNKKSEARTVFAEQAENQEDFTWDTEPPAAPRQRDVVNPIRRSEPKVGRNDPCPCGSGKKYKKCCGK